MKSDSLEYLEQKSNDSLCNFVKWKAMHILEKRKLEPLANAARYSAIAAVISALVALLSLSLNFYLVYSANAQSESAKAHSNRETANQE